MSVIEYKDYDAPPPCPLPLSVHCKHVNVTVIREEVVKDPEIDIPIGIIQIVRCNYCGNSFVKVKAL